MDYKEIIEYLIKTEGITKSKVAEGIGTSHNNLSMKLRSKNMSLESFIQIIDTIGYEIIIKPKDKEDRFYKLESAE